MKIMKSNIKYYLILFLFYCLAHFGLFFISNGIYWDDWAIYRSNPEILLSISKRMGKMFDLEAYLHIIAMHVGPWFYKLATFLLMFFTGIFLDRILRRHINIEASIRMLIVLFFLILPFNLARSLICVFQYTVCYFLFFLAWCVYDKNKIIACILFFISFNTNSLLVFYAIPFLEISSRNIKNININSVFTFIKKNIVLTLLPFIYFTFKFLYFKPSDEFLGYNQGYSLTSIFKSAIFQFLNIFNTKLNIGLTILLILATYLLVKKLKINTFSENSLKNIKVGLGLGLGMIFFACFPYWIVGHVPTFIEWSSRHQLLMPLGFSVLIVSLVQLMDIKRRIFFISIIAGASISISVSSYFEYFIDWQKQTQLITLLKNDKVTKVADLVVFNDNTLSRNYHSREYRFYEWNGILENAYQNEKKFGIRKSELLNYMQGDFDNYFHSIYKSNLHIRSKNICIINVDIIEEPDEKFISKIKKLFIPNIKILTHKEISIKHENNCNTLSQNGDRRLRGSSNIN